jgi:hypothetical protein
MQTVQFCLLTELPVDTTGVTLLPLPHMVFTTFEQRNVFPVPAGPSRKKAALICVQVTVYCLKNSIKCHFFISCLICL